MDVSAPLINLELTRTGLRPSPEGAKALLEARERKAPLELECIRSVATIIDGSFSTMARYLRVGRSERGVGEIGCLRYRIMSELHVRTKLIKLSGPLGIRTPDPWMTLRH